MEENDMSNFIEQIAKKIYTAEKERLSKVLVVFPSRRAGVYFRQELSLLIDKPVWSPTVVSINEFTSKFSKYDLADNLTLIMELYKSYKKYFTEESFDDFYGWGEMLIKDFDEIDKHLVNAEHLFKVLKDEKEIEEAFPAEISEEAKDFWGSLLKINSENEYKKNFLKIWDKLFDIYTDYKNSLVSQSIAYEGLAIRDVAEGIKESDMYDVYEKIYFAGFNSLNKCEQRIIGFLKDKGKAEIYWDADKYYLNDVKQEAGFFVRKFHKLLGGEIVEPEESMSDSVKNIKVIGSPLNTGMLKTFGNELNNLLSDKSVNLEKTLVVVPDSASLLPALYTLPENLESVNVTMGLPLKSTPLFNLVSIIHKLHTNRIFEDGKFKFYFKDVINLLMHPYIKFSSAKEIFGFARKVNENNLVYIDVNEEFLKDLSSKGIQILLSKIFYVGSDVSEIIKSLNDIINSLALRMEGSQDSDNNYKLFQLEYLYNFSTQLNRLTDALQIEGIEMNQFTFWNMLMQMLSSTNVVFTGEPLKGLQVMGLLETRNLAFDNVFILSMNEASMPQSTHGLSYVPYSLRKAFGMPTYEESDSISAYYFYSLIQKAKNVFLFYNTEVGNEVKEKSRYILQIENELAKINTNVKYESLIVSTSVNESSDSKIEIQKTKELNEFIFKSVLKYSPTDLCNYISCGLQFYLKKVMKLKEAEGVEEIFSAATFGTVFHGIMQALYTPYKGTLITKKIIQDLIDKVDNDFDEVFYAFLNSKPDLKNVNFSEKGRNVLYKSVIQKLVRKLLEQEMQRDAFKITGLEEKLNTNFTIVVNGTEREINIGGVIDRIDEAGDSTMVIDYKTGEAKLNKLNEKTAEKFWEELGSNVSYKANFQTLFYAYMLYIKEPNKKYNAGLYPVKKLSKEIITVSDTSLGGEDMKKFGEVLKKVLEDIFDLQKPFSQTEDEKNCKYCDFKSLCRR